MGNWPVAQCATLSFACVRRACSGVSVSDEAVNDGEVLCEICAAAFI